MLVAKHCQEKFAIPGQQRNGDRTKKQILQGRQGGNDLLGCYIAEMRGLTAVIFKTYSRGAWSGFQMARLKNYTETSLHPIQIGLKLTGLRGDVENS